MNPARFVVRVVVVLVLALGQTTAKAKRVRPATASASAVLALDCTFKGGEADGKHIMVSISPALSRVAISFGAVSNIQDIILIDRHEFKPIAASPDPQMFPSEAAQSLRASKRQRKAAAMLDPNSPKFDKVQKQWHEDNYDPVYGGRTPYRMARVFVEPNVFIFGVDVRLQAGPNDPGAIEGPHSRFYIDRRTGAIDFSYNGTVLSGTCTKKKPWP